MPELDLNPPTGDAGPETEQSSARASRMVEHFFRHETARLHGTLVRLLGLQHLTLIEDVTQEALLRALRAWSIGGLPDNPSAWITRVAMNIARDVLRHKRMSMAKEPALITYFETTGPNATDDGGSEQELRDDGLRLMFVCCHPSISPDAQVALALKVLCGFSTAEIARAFLTSEAAVAKQLTRTKQRIQTAGIRFDIPEGEDLAARLDGVLAALYLLFNEGYKASAGERLLREELCHEAIRLTTLLVEHPAGKTPRSHALLALMLLTTARFPSRLDEHGHLLRLDNQDRSRWDHFLIEGGLIHLAASADGNELTDYHLQAAIAACHCTAADYASTDWARILGYYDQLQQIRPSPVVALNRAVAVAHLHGPQAGLDEIAKISRRDRLESQYLLHAVVGELQWRLKNHQAAKASFRRALQLAQVEAERLHLRQMLQRSSDVSHNDKAESERKQAAAH